MDKNDIIAMENPLIALSVAELERAIAKHGMQEQNTYADWMMILLEEVGEVAEVFTDIMIADRRGDVAIRQGLLRNAIVELAQCVAMMMQIHGKAVRDMGEVAVTADKPFTALTGILDFNKADRFARVVNIGNPMMKPEDYDDLFTSNS